MKVRSEPVWTNKINLRKVANRYVVFAILFTLPIDFFLPTGLIFREFGAKPAIIILSVLAIAVLFNSIIYRKKIHFLKTILFEYSLIFFFGITAFLFMVNENKLDFFASMSPSIQFFRQSLMMLSCLFSLIFITHYFSYNDKRSYIISLIPYIALIHELFFLTDFLSLDEHAHWFFSYFKTENAGYVGRASGLMSEPSYFGAFSALFGMPLLLLDNYRQKAYRALGLILLISAFSISAKTMFLLILLQLFFFNFYVNSKFKKNKIFIFAVLALVGIIYNNLTNKFLNVNEDLSTAMRFGSSLLGLNIAISGYGLTGIGIGQFHFFYKDEYAPSWLFDSAEANDQFDISFVKSRASTYNMFIRLFVETGFIGVLLYFDIIRRAFRSASFSLDPAAQFGTLLTSGSVGFLMTQDTYFYPPMVLGLALMFSNIHFDKFTRK